jgi:N-acetylneuraminic acid mutarotase
MKKLYLFIVLIAGLFNTSIAQWDIIEMPLSRLHHSAVAVNGKVVIAGGFRNNLAPTTSVNIYDIATGAWSSVNLIEARGLMGAVVHGDKVYFAGGGDFYGGISDKIDVYDSKNDQWTTMELSLPRLGVGAAVVGDKLIFAGGAQYTASWTFINSTDLVEIYDVVTETWEYAALSHPRAFMAVATAGNKVFFAGGGGDGNVVSDVVDIYDAANNTWTVETLSSPRGDVSAVAVGDKVLFAAGNSLISDGYSVVDIYDLTTETWSIDYMPDQHRGGDMAEAVLKGKAYFIGGAPYIFNGTWGTVFKKVSIYDPVENSWSTDELTYPRVAVAATVWENQLFVCSGFNWNQGLLSSVEIFTDTTTVTAQVIAPVIPPTVLLYPNPARDLLTIELPATSSFHLEILDAQGHRLYFRTDVAGPIVTAPVGGLPAGVYLIRIWNEAGHSVHRFVRGE